MKKETCFGVIPLREQSGKWETFLVHHKRGDYWGFPKGHWNEQESPHQVAERELQEETGLSLVRWIPKPPLQETYQLQREGNTVEKTVTYFPALVEGEISFQAEEINDGKWVAVDQAKDLLTFSGLKTQCVNFFHGLAK